MRKSLLASAALAAAGLTAPAQAQVFYSVTGTFQADTDGDQTNEIYDWAFAFESASYVSTLSYLAPSSCSITGTFYLCGPTQTIDPQGVLAGAPVTNPFIGFNAVNADATGSGVWNYFFAPGAFGADGVYTTAGYPDPSGPIIDPDSGQEYYVGNAGLATLTVRTATAAVPEPATWAMMLLGFGLVGAALRRPKRDLRIRYA
ncbi:MAG: hypothetical protein B7Z33_01640 [Sphingomonadales bacterium 12-68-11]|nr:MAG: hypothetical protein B7Z33_01640 [Sphingomonadales bacterium 12-68-11]